MEIIDDFLICLNEDYDNNAMFIDLLQQYSKDENLKIHIINYSSLNGVNLYKECYTKWEQNNFDFGKSEVVFVETQIISMDWVEEYVEKLSSNDYVFIIGSERLLPYVSSKKVVQTEINEITYNSSYLCDEDWFSFTKWLDMIYGKYQNKLKGIVCTIYVDEPSRKLINNYLEKSNNLSIIGTGRIDFSQVKRDFDYEIFYKNLSCGNYDFLVNYLEHKKNQLKRNEYIDLLKDLYLNFGFFNNAVDLLSNEEELRLDHKKLLINLLIQDKNKRCECIKLANDIYESNRFEKDLMPIILKLYEGSDEFKKWLKISLEIDPNNPKVLEYYANWLSDKNRFFEAANEFKRLKKITKNNYYDFVERMNRLLDNPSKDFRENIDYLIKPILNNPDEYNDALYRLCLYYQTKKPSDYITYALLNRINFAADIHSQIPLLKLKARILQDIFSAKRALGKLKPEKKDSHRNIIGKERIKFVVKSIPTFSKVEKGYLEWGNFIDQSQSQESWRCYIIDELLFLLTEIDKYDIDFMIKSSWANDDRLNNDSNNKISKFMILLKDIANENYKDDDVSTLIIGILKFAEIEKDDRIKIWGRFYSAIIKIQQGMFQDSNDCALTILEYYDKMSKENKDMCIQLGLVAWAISQYRVGRETEGMLCMLASMHYIEKSHELLPFIEFGITMICDFIQKNYKLLSLEQKETLREIISKYVDLNIEAEYTKELLSNNLEKKVQISKLALYFVSEDSFKWRVAIVQTVDGLFALEKYEDAINMIISNAALIVESLAERKDIRPNKILNWLNHIKKSSLIHHQQDNKNTIYYLIDIALNDFEESRTVKHKAERAAIGEKINDLARIFFEFFGCFESIENKVLKLDINQVKKIEKYISFLTPRAFVEQKKYYSSNTVDNELEEIEKKYNLLRNNYNILYQKTNGKSESLNTLGLEIEKLQKILKTEHPNYRALVNCESISIHEVQHSLDDKSIVFQYVLLDSYIFQLLISDTNVFIIFKKINKIDFDEKIELINKQVNVNVNLSIKLIEEISSNAVSLLFSHTDEIQCESLFLIPDLSLGSFNSNLCYMNKTWLIEKITSIKCLMDYKVILSQSKKHRVLSIGNRIFGNEQDRNLSFIRSFLTETESKKFMVFDNIDDNIRQLLHDVSNSKIDTLFIYGHGISDLIKDSYGGAQGIQGKSRLIRVEELLKTMKSVENLLLLSCSGGVPLEQKKENLSGYWADVFSSYEGTIVLCRWNVDTKPAIELIKHFSDILFYNGDVSKSLNMALRRINKDEISIEKWAGIECWVN